VTDLTLELKESTSAAVFDGDEVVYVLRIPVMRIMSINLGVDSRLPAGCTSMGRVLLAALPHDDVVQQLRSVRLTALTPKTVTDSDRLLKMLAQVLLQGWSLVNEEIELGLISLAVLIADRFGRMVAALNVSSGPQLQSAPELQVRYLPALQSVAAEISRVMAA
jgi:IclR family transcriptional regulator, pca regulon regulatory protein